MTHQVWMITGASAGFGRAFADYAVSQGHRVIATARRADKLKELTDTHGDAVIAIPMDVTDPEQIADAMATIRTGPGRVDVLINNAGYGTVGAVEETPMEEMRAQMETNFFGAFAVTQAVLPMMRAQGSGAIVMMSSMGGQMSFAGFGPYSASKFAMEGLTEALAQEIAPLGLKAMIVEPGAFRTDFAGGAFKHMPKLPAYADTVGGTREFAQSMDGTQAGDPARAAWAIDTALQAEQTPLRLVLGDDAFDAVTGHAQSMLADLTTWEETSRAMSFPET